MATSGVNHWLLEIQRELDNGRVDVVPKGWQTTEQIAKEINRSKGYTRKMITRSRKAGLIEEKVFRIKRGSFIFPVKHCRKLVKPKA